MYRALYRKWRPCVFDDVIGQTAVTDTLRRQVSENRLSHAYLFTGTRGTGKTTCAKILSRAMNCQHTVDGNPCNECEICRGIADGNILDVVEMDAASNRRIEDMRALLEEVNFMPSQAKFRVYIVDEVHMLTTEAFNALLKTLEEPPEHVKFILATTEAHKLPSTILSRCQRFDFRRIDATAIAQRLMTVAKEEGAALAEDAALYIARIADGGMRDALSLLDRALGVSDNVTVDVVTSCAGLVDNSHITKLTDAIAAGDTSLCLGLLDELHHGSGDTDRLCADLTERFRVMLLINTTQNPENLITCSPEEMESIKTVAAKFNKEQLIYGLNVLADAGERMRRTLMRRIELELAIIKLCSPAVDDSASAAVKLAALERELAELKASGVAAAPAVSPVSIVSNSQPVENIQPAKDFSSAAEKTSAAEISDDDVPPPDDEFAGGAEFEDNGENTGLQNDSGDDSFDFDAFMAAHSNNIAATPAQQLTNDGSNIPVDKKQWREIVLGTESAFKPIIGMLTNSSAFIRGQTVYVRVQAPSVKMYLPEPTLAQYMTPVVKKVLGSDYKVKYE